MSNLHRCARTALTRDRATIESASVTYENTDLLFAHLERVPIDLHLHVQHVLPQEESTQVTHVRTQPSLLGSRES